MTMGEQLVLWIDYLKMRCKRFCRCLVSTSMFYRQVVLRTELFVVLSAYEELLAYHQADLSMSLSMSMSMSMSMSLAYQGTQVSRDGSDRLQPVSFDSIASSSSAPTAAKVTTLSSVESVKSDGNADVSVREVIAEKTALNAGSMSGRKDNDGGHPIIFVVLAIAAGVVVAVVVVRKIGQLRGRNTVANVDSSLSHLVTEETVSRCV